MKKFYLGFLCLTLFSSVELQAGKVIKKDRKNRKIEKKIDPVSSEVPILEEKDESLERKVSTSTTHSDKSDTMDVESPETLTPQELKKNQNMAILFEAALKNIGNDFNERDLEHLRSTFKTLSPEQQHKFLNHFSFEKVEHHLLNNLKSIYYHLNTK